MPPKAGYLPKLASRPNYRNVPVFPPSNERSQGEILELPCMVYFKSQISDLRLKAASVREISDSQSLDYTEDAVCDVESATVPGPTGGLI